MRTLSPRVALLLLLGGVLALNAPVLGAPFLWDDKTLIRDSSLLGDPARLGEALTKDFWALSANPREMGMYRPVVTATYFADRALFGLSPVGPHLVNVALQLGVVALLWALARALGARDGEALLAAALFAAHPANVEAVANIASRCDLLSTGFVLAALLALRRPGRDGLALAAVATALAQLSKESAYAALPLALLVEWWVAGRPAARRLGAVALTVGGVTVATLALRAAVLGQAVRTLAPDWVPGLTGASTLARYAALVAWPSPLVPYQPPTQPSFIAAALVALALVGVVVSLRRTPLLAFAAGWLLVSTAPMCGWLPVEVRFSGLLLHLPLTGLALATARALRDLKPPVTWALVGAATVASASLVPQWRGDEPLWSANVEAWPALAAPRLNLANALAARQAPEAKEAYLAAIDTARAAQDQKSLALASLGLGNLLLRDAPAEAQVHFERASALSQGRLWQAGINVAVAAAMQGKHDAAEAALEAQWRVTPVPQVAAAALKLATQRGDAVALERWSQRAR